MHGEVRCASSIQVELLGSGRDFPRRNNPSAVHEPKALLHPVGSVRLLHKTTVGCMHWTENSFIQTRTVQLCVGNFWHVLHNWAAGSK